MRRDIVFVHIPKTAGTSTRILLQRSVVGHLILRDYGGAPETTPELHELIYVQGRISDFRDHFAGSNDGIFLSGHFPASRYWEFFNAESFVTFLRDPIERVLSEYAHWVNHKDWTASFEEFVIQPSARNVISTFLAGIDLDRFGFIGFMEEFDACVSALSEFVGVKLPMRKLNLGIYGAIDQEILTNNKYRSIVAELNQEDIALYNRLRELRRDSPLAMGSRTAMEAGFRGKVRLKPDGMAIGWLCNDARESIAEVEVLRNGEHAALIKADLYRGHLKTSGHSRSGVCGFQMNLQDLPSSGLSRATPEKISFRVAGSDFELKGSPILFEPRRHGDPSASAPGEGGGEAVG